MKNKYFQLLECRLSTYPSRGINNICQIWIWAIEVKLVGRQLVANSVWAWCHDPSRWVDCGATWRKAWELQQSLTSLFAARVVFGFRFGWILNTWTFWIKKKTSINDVGIHSNNDSACIHELSHRERERKRLNNRILRHLHANYRQILKYKCTFKDYH